MKDKQIIIDYGEYLELVKYKEMIEEAKDHLVCGRIELTSDPMTRTTKQRINGASKLFDYLRESDDVSEIVLKREN